MGLTMLRLLLLPLFLWIILLGARYPTPAGIASFQVRWLALGIFALMALTDKLDGYLARRFNQTSKLGAILDPVADKLLIACSLILLSFPWVAPSGLEVPMLVILAVYGKDLGVALGAMILLVWAGRLEITPRLLGKISTVLQLVLVLVTLAAADLQRLNHLLTVVVIHSLWWLVVLAAAAATVDYALQGAAQSAQHRQRRASASAQEMSDLSV
jgi:CDP-diacylglycerol--glycerol-3-phosphate 3-phosphatidyltransferase